MLYRPRFTEKQKAIHDDLLSLNEAFRRGLDEFVTGTRQPYTFTKAEKHDLFKRNKAFEKGNASTVNTITQRFIAQGIFLVDHFKVNQDSPYETKGEVYRLANNPYRSGSLLSKEWERGFNTAYFRNQRQKSSTQPKGKDKYLGNFFLGLQPLY